MKLFSFQDPRVVQYMQNNKNNIAHKYNREKNYMTMSVDARNDFDKI